MLLKLIKHNCLIPFIFNFIRLTTYIKQIIKLNQKGDYQINKFKLVKFVYLLLSSLVLKKRMSGINFLKTGSQQELFEKL